MWRFYTIFIFLFVILSAHKSTGQTQNDHTLQAQKYTEQQDYKNAALEYEYLYYSAKDIQTQNFALFNKAQVEKLNKQYSLSAQTLARIPSYSLSSEQKDSVYYQMLLCYYLYNDTTKARELLNNMDIIVKQNASKQLKIMEIISLNELYEYEQAEKIAQTFSDTIYNNLPKLKSEKTAHNLAFIPGLGHIYAGYTWEGIFTFLTNAGVLSFGIYQALNGDYITAYIGGAGILSATYLGQQRKAVQFTKKHNYKKTRSFNTKVKETLLK